MSTHDPIAYTYDADTHCPTCAVARFGQAQEIRCAVCYELGNLTPVSMAGQHHRYGPIASHDFLPWRKVWPWPPEDARDGEGNPLGAVFQWDEWCGHPGAGPCLTCGTCGEVIAECTGD